MKKESTEVTAFYDQYVAEQANTGINDRIYGVYERMKALGFSNQSSVLELGCGIGMMTSLLKRTVNQGKIHAIDISEASITMEKRNLEQHTLPSVRKTFCLRNFVNYAGFHYLD